MRPIVLTTFNVVNEKLYLFICRFLLTFTTLCIYTVYRKNAPWSGVKTPRGTGLFYRRLEFSPGAPKPQAPAMIPDQLHPGTRGDVGH